MTEGFAVAVDPLNPARCRIDVERAEKIGDRGGNQSLRARVERIRSERVIQDDAAAFLADLASGVIPYPASSSAVLAWCRKRSQIDGRYWSRRYRREVEERARALLSVQGQDAETHRGRLVAAAEADRASARAAGQFGAAIASIKVQADMLGLKQATEQHLHLEVRSVEELPAADLDRSIEQLTSQLAKLRGPTSRLPPLPAPDPPTEWSPL